jgi:hypothetical protein
MAVVSDEPAGADRVGELSDGASLTLMYEPLSIIVSFMGGLVASRLFIRIWRVLSGEHDAPAATDDAATWAEILPAAALHGLVFGVVKALTDRVGAKAFQRVTGSWPGKRSSARRSGSRKPSPNRG